MSTKKIIHNIIEGTTLTIVDAGCAGGIDPFFNRLSDIKGIKAYGFEPSKKEFLKLSKLSKIFGSDANQNLSNLILLGLSNGISRKLDGLS